MEGQVVDLVLEGCSDYAASVEPGASVAVALDPLAGTSQPVYPLCDIAFGNAAEALRVSDSAADWAIESSSSTGPPTAVSPSASPWAFDELAVLDEAMRRCSSVEEFAAAAALHPDVLGEIGAMEFLIARCRNPATDLSRYATCASLERALATPTPTPVATTSPSPVATATPSPEPTAKRTFGTESKKKAEPTRTPRPKPRATPRPTPRSDWDRQTKATAKWFKGYVRQLYREYIPDVFDGYATYMDAYFAGVPYNRTPEERAYPLRQARILKNAAKRALKEHLAALNKYPTARCYRDAYAADRRIAKKMIAAIKYSDAAAWRRQIRASRSFVDRLPTYFADCR